jgi:hypothetical protein
MGPKFRTVKLLIVILSICLISVVSATTLKGSSYYINKDQNHSAVSPSENIQSNPIAKNGYAIAGIKLSGVPEHQSYLLFISSFVGIVGIGWVKRKKA